MRSWLEQRLFGHRNWIIAAFGIITVLLLLSASQLRIDAGFTKLLPLQHEYMKTFIQYREDFGGANRVVVALESKQGDIFNAEFLEALSQATDEVFFIPGVDRTRVKSIFTPNVRFTEVVEDGIAGGNVVPNDFTPTAVGIEQLQANVIKAGIVGRLVANDFSSAIISAQLLDTDPNTGEQLDYIAVAAEFEKRIRERFNSPTIETHIIGFTKIIGDIAAGASRVVLFFAIAFIVTFLLVYNFTRSLRLTIIPLGCSLIAIIWQLGILTRLGYGLDPMSMLVPFLIFAIGVSHGVQMIRAHSNALISITSSTPGIAPRITSEKAARDSFHRLLIPGSLALASDTIGFITILIIDIGVIQEMAITASIGVAVMILTNLMLLPLLLSTVQMDDAWKQKLEQRLLHFIPLWQTLACCTKPRPALAIISIALLLTGLGLWKATDISIGDLHQGVPELRSDSRYNLDSAFISKHFSIGVDTITVIVESQAEACIDHEVLTLIDQLEWRMRNVPGVQSVIALPGIIRVINAGWNEGSLKWRELPRNSQTLAQSVAYIPSSSGLLNQDCSVMPVYVFTRDHRAETIHSVTDAVKAFRNQHGSNDIKIRLASGNVGVMAATNEVVDAAQSPILIYVFSAIIILCLITFRSLAATLCIVLPLALVSLLAYALMSVLEIGLKVSTLPVVALGVGIGVDYGIYIYSRMHHHLKNGKDLTTAYQLALETSGSAVIITALTLAIGVATWIFSPLQFQADMGILLGFMFLVNMFGAIVLLPALACWLLPKR